MNTRRDAVPVLDPPVEQRQHGQSLCCDPTNSLTTERLTLHYGTRCAFRDLTLHIHSGKITALVGPSGCGKTSFLMCLNRMTDLIPSVRVTGKVCYGQVDIYHAGVNVTVLRQRIGMIFQKPNPFPLSIRKNIEFPLREHGVRDAQKRMQILEQVLTDVGLWNEVKDRLDAPGLSLSGGQQQRLCIARALALDPEVLLLDEPCSALDPLASGVVEDLIVKLRNRYTLLIVTHNLAQARRIADHVAVFWNQNGFGQLIEYGPVQQIFDAPCDALTASYINGSRG